LRASLLRSLGDGGNTGDPFRGARRSLLLDAALAPLADELPMHEIESLKTALSMMAAIARQARRGHGSLVRRLYAQRCRCPPLGIAGQVAVVERVDALAVIALGRLLNGDDVGVDRCGFGQQRVSELEADRVMAVLGRGPATPHKGGSIYRLLARGFPRLA